MRKFILNFTFFSVPFFILALSTALFYSKSGGDLNRVGKISIKEDYRQIFREAFMLEKKYVELSEVNIKVDDTFDIFTIGDSFSGQGNYGYQNYLATLFDYKVINFNPTSYNIDNYNPLQFLFQVGNSDFFDNLHVDYIILQSVEREFVKYLIDTDTTDVIIFSKMNNLKKRERGNYGNSGTFRTSGIKIKNKLSSYINDVVLFHKNNLLYQFSDRAYSANVYKMTLNKTFFSIDNDDILIYHRDIKTIERNTKDAIFKLNNTLNQLSKMLKKRNIKLIVLPCVDKYDLYYHYLDNNKYSENMFFKYFKTEYKDFLYIDSKKILTKLLTKNIKDVYFADDSHWSPIASKEIAKEIALLIEKENTFRR